MLFGDPPSFLWNKSIGIEWSLNNKTCPLNKFCYKLALLWTSDSRSKLKKIDRLSTRGRNWTWPFSGAPRIEWSFGSRIKPGYFFWVWPHLWPNPKYPNPKFHAILRMSEEGSKNPDLDLRCHHNIYYWDRSIITIAHESGPELISMAWFCIDVVSNRRHELVSKTVHECSPDTVVAHPQTRSSVSFILYDFSYGLVLSSLIEIQSMFSGWKFQQRISNLLRLHCWYQSVVLSID